MPHNCWKYFSILDSSNLEIKKNCSSYTDFHFLHAMHIIHMNSYLSVSPTNTTTWIQIYKSWKPQSTSYQPSTKYLFYGKCWKFCCEPRQWTVQIKHTLCIPQLILWRTMLEFIKYSCGNLLFLWKRRDLWLCMHPEHTCILFST